MALGFMLSILDVRSQNITSCKSGEKNIKITDLTSLNLFGVINKKSTMDFDKGVILKKNKKISIPVADTKKSVINFIDKKNGDDDPKNVSYTYVGVYKKYNLHIVKEVGYETEDYILVNGNSGKCVKLWGVPHLSPDGSKILSYAANIDYDPMPNGIQIIELQGNLFRCMVVYYADDWEPSAVVWKDDKTLYLEKTFPSILSSTKQKKVKYSLVVISE